MLRRNFPLAAHKINVFPTGQAQFRLSHERKKNQAECGLPFIPHRRGIQSIQELSDFGFTQRPAASFGGCDVFNGSSPRWIVSDNATRQGIIPDPLEKVSNSRSRLPMSRVTDGEDKI